MDLDRDALEQMGRETLIELVLALQARLVALEAEVARLTAGRAAAGDDPPASRSSSSALLSGIRPNRPARAAKASRRKRTHQFARRRDTSTQLIEHVVDAYPSCGTTLMGGEVVRRRQVFDIPRVPVAVIEHLVRRRVCPHCGMVATPTLDLEAEVVGHHRVSAATLAYVASLRAVGRLPIRTIQWLLDTGHGLHLSAGGIVGLLQAVTERGTTTLEQLQAEAKAVAAQGLSEPERVAARTRLDTALLALVQPGLVAESPLPQTTLCQRIDRFDDELFEFVLYPAVPPDNNLAERSLRPLVVARKISGGTRSAAGSPTRMALASLFSTWQAQGRDSVDACQQMLIAPAL